MSPCYASLEPRVGKRLDIYPPSAQERIGSLSADNDQVFLNKDCFGATVHRRGTTFFQTTPRIANKPSGFRDVVLIDPTSSDRLIVYKTDNGWRVHPTNAWYERAEFVIGDAIVYPLDHFVWQWCTNTDIASAVEAQWISYSASDSAAIEAAFDVSQEITIAVGVRNYRLSFVRSTDGEMLPYARQIDDQRARYRWVRRAASRSVTFETPISETTCALCCETFQDTPHMPWTQTLCRHVFHSTCLAALPTGSTCPMCRSQLNHSTSS